MMWISNNNNMGKEFKRGLENFIDWLIEEIVKLLCISILWASIILIIYIVLNLNYYYN